MKQIIAAALLVVSVTAVPAFAGDSPANEKIVAGFVDSWAAHDVEKTLGYVTDDCFYHNIPLEPIKGKAKMREFLTPFFKKDGFSAEFELKPEILNVVSKGKVVFQERIDHYVVGKAHYDIPVVGVYEIRDGRIAVWKDYFDMAQFQPVVLLMQALQK